ncbi:MAG TPA: dicarboxylate/amino acid:cation symporter [Gemmatimonadaceae bacterium]|nr:dicarboxylate/amino acid:cation symporter [Gemmatimonadaceae bacterium]
MSESTGHSGKGLQLHTKILLGLVIGALLGIAANLTLGGTHPLVEGVNHYLAGPVGQIFLNLLFMIVIPLVFASIALGVAGLGDLRRVGRVGAKTLGFFLTSTALSVLVGLVLVQLIRPGSRITPAVRTQLLQTYAGDAASRIEAAASSTFGMQTLVNIVTRNPVRSAVDLDLLGIIFFGIIFGAAITMIAAERAKFMMNWLEALNDIVLKIVDMAMKLAPYGVAGLIFGVTSRFGFSLLLPLSVYATVVVVGLLLHAVINYSWILRLLVRVSPLTFFSRVKAPIVTAFSTSSSSGTLPTSIATAEQNLGMPPQIAGFVLPLGATMNMNGTSLYEGVTVIFLAQVFGVDLTIGQQLVVMLMCVVTAVGAAGVPGGSLPLLVGILAMFRVPAEGIALILGIDRILDMSRTTVNVLGDLVATAFIGRSERVWDASMIPAEGVEAGAGALDESPGWPPPQVPEVPEAPRKAPTTPV